MASWQPCKISSCRAWSSQAPAWGSISRDGPLKAAELLAACRPRDMALWVVGPGCMPSPVIGGMGSALQGRPWPQGHSNVAAP